MGRRHPLFDIWPLGNLDGVVVQSVLRSRYRSWHSLSHRRKYFSIDRDIAMENTTISLSSPVIRIY